MPTPIAFGEIAGYPEGSTFVNREAVFAVGLHRRTQHGISGRAHDGADATSLNGGYKDDRDFGDVIVSAPPQPAYGEDLPDVGPRVSPRSRQTRGVSPGHLAQ